MKTKTEFEAFWNANLESKLEKLRQAKLDINKRLSYKKYGYSVLALFLILIVLSPLFYKLKWEGVLPLLVFVSVLYSIFWPVVIFVRRHFATDPLEKEYINSIPPLIVSFINPNLKFEFDKGLTLEEFNKSEFLKNANKSISNILISGKKTGKTMRISGFIAQERSMSTRRDGKSHRSTTAFFDGIYAIIDLSNTYSTTLTVKHKEFNKVSLGKSYDVLVELGLYKDDTQPADLVKTGNAEFDSKFEVACANEWEARNFLNPAIQIKLIQFHKDTNFCFGFKFMGSELFVFSPITDFFNSAFVFDFEKKENSELFFHYINSTMELLDIILPSASE